MYQKRVCGSGDSAEKCVGFWAPSSYLLTQGKLESFLTDFRSNILEILASDVSTLLCAETAPHARSSVPATCATLVAVTRLFNILLDLGLVVPDHAVVPGSRECRRTCFFYRL